MTNSGKAEMDADKLHKNLQTYGSRTERWPDQGDASGSDFVATIREMSAYRQASALDAALDRYETPVPSATLIGSILAAGERQASRRNRFRRFCLGIGLVGVGLAGGLTGAVAVMTLAPAPQIYGNDVVTAFGQVPGETDMAEEAR